MWEGNGRTVQRRCGDGSALSLMGRKQKSANGQERTVASPVRLKPVAMNNLQAFSVALCLCAIGGGLIWLAVYVIANYAEVFRKSPDKTLLRDVISVVLAGPWSAPVALAALTTALGATALFVGSSIALYILWFEVTHP